MAEGVTRGNISTEWIELSVGDGTTMPAYVARPAGGGQHPGLIVCQEAFGVNAHIRDVTERFAREGYISITPALFHRTDPKFEGSYTDFATVMPHVQALTDEGLIADVLATHAWLTAPDGGGAEDVGSIGYCMGGRVSFLADTILPLKASVSYYGGGIGPNSQGRASLLSRAGDLRAPILLFWGGLDGHIGPEQRSAIETALIEAGKDFINVVFSKAEHGFFCDARASYNPDAAKHAWALTLSFFETYLGR